MIGGVCSGLADYFLIDPSLIRILFVLMAFAGIGVLLYLILLIAVPEKPIDFSTFESKKPDMENSTGTGTNPAPENPNQDPYRDHFRKNKSRGNLIGGLVLITLGVLFLADEFIPHIRFGDLWPIILVVIGIGLLINSITGRRKEY